MDAGAVHWSLCKYCATRNIDCGGLTDSPCPIANRIVKVSLCQGDLMLCDHCNNVRFGSKTKEQRDKEGKGTKASAQISSASKPNVGSCLQ